MPNDSSPNPILAFSINPDSVQCSQICRGWEQSSSSSGLSESCTLCKQSSFCKTHDFPLPHVQECPQVCYILVGLTCLSELQSHWWYWHFDGYPAKQATLLNETKSMHITV